MLIFNGSSLFVLLLCVHTLTASIYTDKKDCPEGWEQYKTKKCFKFIPVEKTQNDAQEDCKTLDGTLASVNSPEEHRFLVEYYLREVPYEKMKDVYVGGRRVGITQHRWIWTDLSPFTYSRWFRGYPINETARNCLGLATGMWNFRDVYDYYGNFWNPPCAQKQSYFCQKILYPNSCLGIRVTDFCEVPKKQ